jgi:alpha-tubulin suppressor-like RCC1 family protein
MSRLNRSLVLIVALSAAAAACDLITGGDGRDAPARENALAVGFQHACALDVDGVAYCWGSNDSGQLGTGDLTVRTTPSPVVGDHRFMTITAGASTTCALTAEGAAYCWGMNSRGQVGDGTLVDHTAPQRVSGELRFLEIHAGHEFVCARADGGAAYCWGDNHMGQTGNTGGGLVQAPTRVAGSVSFASVTAGLLQACGLTSDGEAYCWGDGQSGSLGNGSRETRTEPTPVSGGHRFASLATGATTTCGITTGGETLCWGTDLYGSLGSGSVSGTPQRLTPARIAGDPGFAVVTPGSANSVFTPACGIRAVGETYCWGANISGLLNTSAPMAMCGPFGDINMFPCSGAPVVMDGNLRFSVVRPAADFVCGITRSGELYCWGNNHVGQLGTTSTETCQEWPEPRPCSRQPLRVRGFRLP